MLSISLLFACMNRFSGSVSGSSSALFITWDKSVCITAIGVFICNENDKIYLKWILMPKIFSIPKVEHDQPCSPLVIVFFTD